MQPAHLCCTALPPSATITQPPAGLCVGSHCTRLPLAVPPRQRLTGTAASACHFCLLADHRLASLSLPTWREWRMRSACAASCFCARYAHQPFACSRLLILQTWRASRMRSTCSGRSATNGPSCWNRCRPRSPPKRRTSPRQRRPQMVQSLSSRAKQRAKLREWMARRRHRSSRPRLPRSSDGYYLAANEPWGVELALQLCKTWKHLPWPLEACATCPKRGRARNTQHARRSSACRRTRSNRVVRGAPRLN